MGLGTRRLPDCAWCAAANTLTVTWTEMGVEFCECSCCTQKTRVVDKIAYRSGKGADQERVTDISGNEMFDP